MTMLSKVTPPTSIAALVEQSQNTDIAYLAEIFARSGFFADTRDAAQAMVKIQAGRELGLGAVASMTGIYIVKGRVSLAAQTMGLLVQRSNKYRYRQVELTDKVCTIRFFEGADPVGESTFTVAEANRAGTQNMGKFPKNMLWARAMSNGCRWYCPEVFGGPVYTPEELGEQVDGQGAPVQPLTIGPITPDRPRAADLLRPAPVDQPPEAAEPPAVPVDDGLQPALDRWKNAMADVAIDRNVSPSALAAMIDAKLTEYGFATVADSTADWRTKFLAAFAAGRIK
jgi:hypothetical protein